MPMGGMIGRAIHDAGRAWDEASASTPQGVKITVSEHNILKAAGIIQAEAQRFKAEVKAITEDIYVKPMGRDPVSGEAARVLNEKFRDGDDSYVKRCEGRAAMLQQLADQLKEAAKTYRLTEDQITSHFNAALHEALANDDSPRGVVGGMRAL